MASSLEELLVEEGFKGKKVMTRSRASFGSDNVTTPFRGLRDRRKPDIKTQRARSDLSRYSLNGRLGGADDIRTRKPHDDLIMRSRMKEKDAELFEGKRSVERVGERRVDADARAFSEHEIVEVDVEKGEKTEEIYFTELDGPLRADGYSAMSDERNENTVENMRSGKKDRTSSMKHGMKQQPGSFADRPGRGSKTNRISDDRRSETNGLSLFSDSLPALDEAAIKATVSILTGYITRFLNDEEFRVSLRDKCFGSLDFSGSEGYPDAESKVMSNLEQAIETVERAAEEQASPKDLKRALLQLSVITGLNTSELKDGLTCRVPNYKLSSIAHLYLSVIHKLHKKDRISAKHILQVFADSPLQGRAILLPELWENFFYPHLSHLKLWHSQEVDSLVDTDSKAGKLKLLNRVYDEILDSGTCQLAVYYKDWLTEGSEAPPFPSIGIPSVSVQTVQLGDLNGHSGELANPIGDAYPQPMVSKRLYETVFGCSNKPGKEDDAEVVISSFDVKEMAPHSCETIKHMDQHSTANSIKKLGDEELPVIEAKSSLGPSAIPQYLICPLTGQLFEDPVTLETGRTFERAAITKWLDEGNETCPVTGNLLQCLKLPLTNIVIKCAVDSWKSEHCKSILPFASRIMKEDESCHLGDGSISMFEQQLVTIYTEEERISNAKHLLSLGGLKHLLRRFEFGTTEEKKRVAALLLSCVEADAGCRDQLAKGINMRSLLELLHSKQVDARTNAVSLLTELICHNRRKDVIEILGDLSNEEIVNAMHVLLLYLRSSRYEQRPSVAVLLLHIDLMVRPQKYSVYREEAVNTIVEALNLSLIDEDVKARCCKALSVLGGCFSPSGKLSDSCILSQAAKLDTVKFGGEDLAHTRWMRYLLASLLGNEKKSFLEAISRCLAAKDSDLVRVCLTTVAWLSSALSSLSNVEFQLSAFSALVFQLKENLEGGQEMEHKILASFCLLNFSKIPECRVLLMTMAEEIGHLLGNIADVTWTAKELHAVISEEDL